MQVQSLGQEDSLGKEMATHSSILAWEIPWTENGGPQSTGSQSQTRLSTQAAQAWLPHLGKNTVLFAQTNQPSWPGIVARKATHLERKSYPRCSDIFIFHKQIISEASVTTLEPSLPIPRVLATLTHSSQGILMGLSLFSLKVTCLMISHLMIKLSNI